MAEDVAGALDLNAFVNEFEPGQFAKLVFDRSKPLPHRSQQPQRKFAADYCSNLEKSLGLLRQTGRSSP